jgi:diaminopimelate decarboxylase
MLTIEKLHGNYLLMKDSSIESFVLKDVDEFLKKNKMSYTTFMKKAKTHEKVMQRLRNKKGINTRTINLLYSFMNNYKKNNKQPLPSYLKEGL